jgi:D-alanine-D-alanine ligase
MKIAVLCGGLSNERDVSISSGTGVARALLARGHDVVLVDLFLGYNRPFETAAEVFRRGEVTLGAAAIGADSPDLEQVKGLRPDADVRIGPNVLSLCRAADLVFLALHGEEGENGKLQAALDLNGVRYTGSGYLGSALAMHKGLSKALFRQAGIPTPESRVLRRGAPIGEMPAQCVVVKPCSGGSSVGTSIVRSPAEYEAAVELAFRYESEVLVETYIQARELTVGVMDGVAMPVIEIIPKNGFYDYQNKYQAGATEELCPAPIGPEATARAQKLAEAVMKALLVDAYCRVDILWDTASDRMYVLEANTLPGMTPTSLIPQMAAAQGLDYGQLCERIMEVSLKKYESADA